MEHKIFGNNFNSKVNNNLMKRHVHIMYMHSREFYICLKEQTFISEMQDKMSRFSF